MLCIICNPTVRVQMRVVALKDKPKQQLSVLLLA